ncbi:MAG: sugar phosphate isomerase/epimerase [Clostridia bacterium]|nr:sugar phosphate isomerase/epimerase [Clostridia bacterium]
MMKIVNTTSVYMPGTDICWVIDQLKDAGFDCLDLALDYCCTPGHPFLSDNYMDWARTVKAYADSKGVSFYQCHGVGDPQHFYNKPDDVAYRSIDVAQALDIQWIAMHPKEIQGKTDEQYDDLFVSENVKWFTPFVKKAESVGVGVAIENLPWPNANRVKPLGAIVDGLQSRFVGVCWDTGHANINGTKPEEIEVLGNRLVTVHLHDNHGVHDEHSIPMDGTYDWFGLMDTLKKMGYKGEFVLEAHHQMLEAKDDVEMQRKLLARMIEVGHQLIGKM